MASVPAPASAAADACLASSTSTLGCLKIGLGSHQIIYPLSTPTGAVVFPKTWPAQHAGRFQWRVHSSQTSLRFIHVVADNRTDAENQARQQHLKDLDGLHASVWAGHRQLNSPVAAALEAATGPGATGERNPSAWQDAARLHALHNESKLEFTVHQEVYNIDLAPHQEVFYDEACLLLQWIPGRDRVFREVRVMAATEPLLVRWVLRSDALECPCFEGLVHKYPKRERIIHQYLRNQGRVSYGTLHGVHNDQTDRNAALSQFDTAAPLETFMPQTSQTLWTGDHRRSHFAVELCLRPRAQDSEDKTEFDTNLTQLGPDMRLGALHPRYFHPQHPVELALLIDLVGRTLTWAEGSTHTKEPITFERKANTTRLRVGLASRDDTFVLTLDGVKVAEKTIPTHRSWGNEFCPFFLVDNFQSTVLVGESVVHSVHGGKQ